MQDYNSSVATFTYTPTNGGTISVQGFVFRAIPHSSQTPLSTSYAQSQGGRWNLADSFPVLYTSGAISSVRAFVDWQAQYYGVEWSDRAPEDEPDLLVLQIEGSFADVATNSGLAFYGLPTTYPTGYLGPESWSITQPIGTAIYAACWPGLVTRSASVSNWSGPMHQWAELALFTDKGLAPRLVDRVDYRSWYPQ